MPDIQPSMLLREISDTIKKSGRNGPMDSAQVRLAELQALAKNWRSAGGCHAPGCRESAIENSHTIQRSQLVKNLGSEAVTPVWSEDGFEIKVRPVRRLSTFPGYCAEHEKMFTFEQEGKFSAPRDDALQIMRATHRELWLTERRMDFLDGLCGLYKTVAGELDGNNLEQNMLARSLGEKSERLFESSSGQHSMRVRLAPLAEDLEKAILSPNGISSGRIKAMDVGPRKVAFHAAVMLNVQMQPLMSIALVFSGNNGRLITAIEPDFESHLEAYWTQYLSSSDSIDEFVTEWLTKGTLDWYASPSWWSGLEDEQRRAIEYGVNHIF